MIQSLQISERAPQTLDAEAVASLWNDAYPDDLAISPRLLAWSLQPLPGRSLTVHLAERGGKAVGFAVSSLLQGVSGGWVDALAVALPRSGRTIRLPLLAAAEGWLRGQGCASVIIGGGPWSLLRGIPAPLRRQRLLIGAGYRSSSAAPLCDMAINLPRYAPPASLQEGPGVVRPAQPGDVDNVLALLADTQALRSAHDDSIPGTADLLHVRSLLEGGRLSDLMLLWTQHGVEGLCHVVFPDSALPVERSYPYQLPRPWSALGSMVVREKALEWCAASLVDGSLRRLHNNGVNSCLVPGVTRTAVFEEYGFRIHRRWQRFSKSLTATA